MKTRAPVLLATRIAAPWGPVHVAASSRGIVALELMTTPDAFSEGLERRLGLRAAWREASGSAETGDAERLLDAAGEIVRRSFGTEAIADRRGGVEAGAPSLPLDIDDRPAFDREVLAAVRAIPRGETRSYADIARAVGRPGAARAVGGAVGRNPVGLLIPCHRVIAADGTLGGYGGGWWGDRDRLLELKAELLAREGIERPRRRSAGPRGR